MNVRQDRFRLVLERIEANLNEAVRPTVYTNVYDDGAACEFPFSIEVVDS